MLSGLLTKDFLEGMLFGMLLVGAELTWRPTTTRTTRSRRNGCAI
jgi:hypothetical protein